MGVSLHLNCRCCGSSLEVPAFREGSNRPAVPITLSDGSMALEEIEMTVAEMSITYNYGGILAEVLGPDFPGMCDFFTDKRAGDLLEDIKKVVSVCGTDRDDDYWKPTPGNVGAIFATLQVWCETHPDGVFWTWC